MSIDDMTDITFKLGIKLGSKIGNIIWSVLNILFKIVALIILGPVCFLGGIIVGIFSDDGKDLI